MKTRFIFLALLLVLCAQCTKEKKTEMVQLSISEFDTLTLNSVFDVYLIQGDSNHITLEGNPKILEKVRAEVTNNTLNVYNDFSGKWLHPSNNHIKLTITTNGLTRINSGETCNIQTLNTLTGNEIGIVMTSKLNQATLDINCNSFYFWNNFPCGGKLTLRGNTHELKIWSVALMAVDAKGLNADIATLDNKSKGEITATVTQFVHYRIGGKGNIQLWGNAPQVVDLGSDGDGKLIQH
jgi:hypothetical protein